MRFFNTAGPTNCEKHYCIEPVLRFDLEETLSLIDQEKYFLLHAPRQTGKTTCMLALMEHLNRHGKYRCLYINVEAAQAARENIRQGMNDILREMSSRAETYLNDTFPKKFLPQALEGDGYGTAFNRCLSAWAENSDNPLVLIMDEIDSLVGDTLISVLRQLRSGYDKRPASFPNTVILCGVRDLRDYRIHSSRQNEIITGGSAFNIKSESLRLGDFDRDEVFALLHQHEEETGQKIEKDAAEKIWDLSQGQPWLVNALAYEACFRSKQGRHRGRSITCMAIEQAKENLIIRRETHLDQLADKLREDRVRRVIEPVLSGVSDPSIIPTDDLQYVEDLGLITTTGQIKIANPIYQEIVPRELTLSTQLTISHEPTWYVLPDGRLDMNKLLSAFQEFFREHSEHWLERFQYKEAGPQLLLQAFLQRIVNSGGRVEREYGLGRMRTDLLVIWPLKSGEIVRTVLELKILRKGLDKTIQEGLEQTVEYMDRCGTPNGNLIIFERRENVSWKQKIFRKETVHKGRRLVIWGM